MKTSVALIDFAEISRLGIAESVTSARATGVRLSNVWGQVEATWRLVAEASPISNRSFTGCLPAQAALVEARA